MTQTLGKLLIIAGILIAVPGVFFLFKDNLPFLKYLGKLPGDIYIKKEKFTFYFPLMTGILASVVISLILYILGRIK